MSFVIPSSTNTFIPQWDATGMLVGFCQDPKRFKFWDYVAARPATKVVGVYCKVDSTQFTWIPNLEAFVWADGQPRPQGEDNRLPFTFPEYSTQRYNIAVPYGKRTLSNSDIPLLAITAQQVMSQIMVLMNKSILTVLDNASNWGTSTADANTLNGGVGNWSTATSANLAIKQTFNAVAQKVSLFTNTVVGKSRLKCVIGTDAAKAIAASNEMADFLKQSPFAMAQVRGDDAQAKWSQYGLPNVLYGVDLVIDDGVITTQRQGDPSRTQAYLKDSTKALFMTVAEKTDGDQVAAREKRPSIRRRSISSSIPGRKMVKSASAVRSWRPGTMFATSALKPTWYRISARCWSHRNRDIV